MHLPHRVRELCWWEALTQQQAMRWLSGHIVGLESPLSLLPLAAAAPFVKGEGLCLAICEDSFVSNTP